MLGSACTKMVMHLSSGVDLGFYANHGKRNSTFKKSSYWKTRLLNCRVSEPPSHQQISEDITQPFRNRVFNLTRTSWISSYYWLPKYESPCTCLPLSASLSRFWKGKAFIAWEWKSSSAKLAFSSWQFHPHHWLVAVVPLLFVVAHLSW